MAESINERVGERIRYCRERAGLTPKQAAEAGGYGYARWVNWENGVRGVGIELVPTIARVVKSTPEYIACFTDTEDSRGGGDSEFLTLTIPGEHRSQAKMAWNETTLLARRLDAANLVQLTVADGALEPEIAAGDVVLIDRTAKHFGGNGVYALVADGELMLRRIHKSPLSGDLVVSAGNNRRWPDETIPAERADQLKLYGRLAGQWHWEDWQD